MKPLRKQIETRLMSLKQIDDVSAKVTSAGQITISHEHHHVSDFIFKWAEDHYIGYFVNAEGKNSQAIISLWTPMEAVKFMALYLTLVELRAKRGRTE